MLETFLVLLQLSGPTNVGFDSIAPGSAKVYACDRERNRLSQSDLVDGTDYDLDEASGVLTPLRQLRGWWCIAGVRDTTVQERAQATVIAAVEAERDVLRTTNPPATKPSLAQVEQAIGILDALPMDPAQWTANQQRQGIAALRILSLATAHVLRRQIGPRPVPTTTPVSTFTPRPTATITPTLAPTATLPPTRTPTRTPTPTPEPSPIGTATPTVSETATQTPTF